RRPQRRHHQLRILAARLWRARIRGGRAAHPQRQALRHRGHHPAGVEQPLSHRSPVCAPAFRGQRIHAPASAERRWVPRCDRALFSVVAGAAGVLVAWWALAAIERLAANQLPPGVTLALDARALVFTAGVSVCSALLVGLMPALQASRANLSEVLNDSARGS